MEQSEVTRIQKMLDNLEIERKAEQERLRIKRDSYQKGTQAFQDANNELVDYQQASNQQQAKLDKAMSEYKTQTFENPYANMENVYEDLTVNQQQAQFQAQQGSQQRANIMQNLRGAAGSSGIAGLAQSMANQGQLQTQQISASIGQQEAANQRLKASGAANVQMQKLGGEQWVQQQEIDRQGTLLGMQMGATSGANQAHQQAQANQMNAQIAQQQMMMDAGGTLGQAAGAGTDAMKTE